MARALVVCPATEELELIEYMETPLGALLHACSRFHPPTGLTCGRACARGRRCEIGRCDAALEVDEIGADTELEIAVVDDSIDGGHSIDPLDDPRGTVP